MFDFFGRISAKAGLILLISIINTSSWAGLSCDQIPSSSPEKFLKLITVSDSDSLVYQLTPTLTVVTKPLGTAKNSASVTFYNGSLLLYTVTVTQTAPVIVCPYNLVLGTLQIEQGMQLTLQIPSSLQPGSIFLQATFSDLNIPSTTFSATVATWNL